LANARASGQRLRRPVAPAEVQRRCELITISPTFAIPIVTGALEAADMAVYSISAILLTMLEVQLLREARRRAGLTQRELADQLGTTQSSIARLESGVVSPTFATLRSAIEACGFEIRVGLGEPDPETDTLFDQTLALTPSERIRQAMRVTRFGRRMQEARHRSAR
jgi:transcriptional regulator with XRE-family HTH domain